MFPLGYYTATLESCDSVYFVEKVHVVGRWFALAANFNCRELEEAQNKHSVVEQSLLPRALWLPSKTNKRLCLQLRLAPTLIDLVSEESRRLIGTIVFPRDLQKR